MMLMDLSRQSDGSESPSLSEGEARAAQFRKIAERYRTYEARSTEPRHISVHIRDYAVKAGRLLVDAIDEGDFPQSRAKTNNAWWDPRIIWNFFKIASSCNG